MYWLKNHDVHTETHIAAMLELVMSNCSAILGKVGAGKVLANGETKHMRPTIAMLAHLFLSGQFNGFLEYPIPGRDAG
jgi:hypothetical protein